MAAPQIENPTVKHSVQQVARNEGFTNYEIEMGAGFPKGDNFMGEVHRVIVRDKNYVHKDLYVIVKIAPAHITRSEIPVYLWYKREMFAYKEVFKVLKGLQDNTNVDPAAKFNFVNCLYASDELNKEVLVFENLNAEGFELLERKHRVEIEHAKLALSSVAKLHALSFVLQKQNPEQYKEIANKLTDFITEQKTYDTFLGLSLDVAIQTVTSSQHKEKLSQLKNIYWKQMQGIIKDEKYSTICHGDYSRNNLLFKSEEGKPVDIRLIDYQILRHGPPCLDILYFLFTSTDGEFRRSHYRSCLDHYYHSLSVALQHFHYDVNDIFPRDEFDKQIERCALYGFLVGVGFCKLMVTDSEDAMKVTEMNNPENMTVPRGDVFDKYLKRLTELVEDCIEYGFV